MNYDLSRFIKAQQYDYPQALAEIKNGRKTSHWIWYIFPQLKGLGKSANCQFYGIQNLEEAKAFLDDPVLGRNLLEITSALLELPEDNPTRVMGRPDDIKLKSCMTLFQAATDTTDVFQKVLDKYYHGAKDHRTLRMLGL